MQIVQAVLGVFHHFELAHQLHRRGHLRKIYSTWPWARLKREGLPRPLVGTFPWVHLPDYLLDFKSFYPPALSREMKRINPLAFDRWTQLVLPPCDAFIGISGAGLLTGQKVQQRGGKYICDRGSTHQRFMDGVLRDESARWGLPLPVQAPHVVEREEACYTAADMITVPSSVARRSFLELGIAPEKVAVIPYGVRLDRFQKTADPAQDTFEVLFAGQVSLRKGVPYLLEAFARVRHPRKHLTLAGFVQAHLKELLPSLPTDQVTFIGAVSQAELVDRMSRSHCLVLPSIEEGLALVQAQAMACECPVIATVATGAEDLFTDGVEGFIVPDRNTDALAQRMQQLADDSNLRAGMAAAAHVRVGSVGGWNEYGRRWDDLLHTLTALPRSHDEPNP